MTEIVTPIPTGAMIPQEYQDQIDAARRKQQIAQMLQAQAMQFRGPQQTGRIAAKTNPLSVLANVGQSGIASYLDSNATAEASNAKKQYETDQSADLAKMLALPEAAQPGYGQQSKFTQNQMLARTLQTQLEKRRELQSGVMKDSGQPEAAMAILNGQPMPPPKPREIPTPWTMDDPETGKKAGFGLTYDNKNVPHLTAIPKASQQTVTLPGDEGKMTTQFIKEELTKRAAKADVAKDTYAASTQAVDALESGAKAGGGEVTKQLLRKAAQAFEITLPETASTEQLQMALLQGVVDRAKNLRPASDTDLKILNQMAGNASTDPTALTKALAFAQSMALKDLQSYNDYASENQKNIDPRIQALFTGATSGYELPRQLQGPMPYQMEVVRQLQRQGFDISKLADPSGKAFDRNAKFDINPTAGFPGVKERVAEPAASAPKIPPGTKVYENPQTGERGAYINGVWTILK